MEVILKQDIVNLGRFGETVKVAGGYARNYLIPRGIAVEATPGNVNQFNAEKGAYLKKEEVRRAGAEKLAGELDGLEITFERKTGDEEKLFGSVTSHDIERELKEKGFTDIEKKDILLTEPIKRLGEFNVSVRLHPDVSAGIKVQVVKEAAEPEAEPKAEPEAEPEAESEEV